MGAITNAFEHEKSFVEDRDTGACLYSDAAGHCPLSRHPASRLVYSLYKSAVCGTDHRSRLCYLGAAAYQGNCQRPACSTGRVRPASLILSVCRHGPTVSRLVALFPVAT